jgi:transcriptional regulator with XRE-family HTH domain
MTLNKKIGQRLRVVRTAQKLSLSELAARTKTLSKSRISNYEQGIRRMGLEEAQELAEALEGVTPSYLLCLDDTAPLTTEELKLVERYRGTDERGKDTILRIAESQGNYSGLLSGGDGDSS